MEGVSLEKCEWCKGTGKDLEMLPHNYPCHDCYSTGFKEGKKAEKYFNYLMEQKEKELTEKGLL